MTAPRRPRTAADPAAGSDGDVPWQNTVVLCGRLTSGPVEVPLPSGDPLWRLRVSVARDPKLLRRTDVAPRRVVDAVDCSTSSARIADRLAALPLGSVVELHGVLTRRFWRAGGAPASRYEVVVTRARVVRRASVPVSVET